MQRKKETLAQVFPSEFCEISQNTFFTEHLQMTILVTVLLKMALCLCIYFVFTKKQLF